MLFLRKEWRSPYLLSLLLLSASEGKLLLVNAEGADGLGGSSQEDVVYTDFLLVDSARPRPSNVGISLDEFQGLLFTHVDNEVGRIDYYESGGLNRASGAEDMWAGFVEHGWDMATMSESGESDEIEQMNLSGPTPSVEKSSSFLVCTRGGQMSGFERLQPVLAAFGAELSDTLVVSNQQDETCRFVTSTASQAFSIAGKTVDSLSFAVIPVFDIMKISIGSIDEVSSERWSIPQPLSHSRSLVSTGISMQNDTLSKDDNSNEWERSIMVGLAPGIGGNSADECEEIAAKIISDVREMAQEGSRRRRLKERESTPTSNLRRAKVEHFDVHRARSSSSISVSDAFSATSTLSNSPARRHLRASTKDVWSRALERGLESNHMCVNMFNDMEVRLRYGNKGFVYLLNPDNNNKGAKERKDEYDVESSASNTDCVISFIAALSTHPHVVTVESNGEVLPDSNTNAQWITQSGVKDYRPLFNPNIDITGAGEIVSVSDGGMDPTSCFFADPEDKKGKGPDIFDGVRLLTFLGELDGV